jgi:ABC-type tungstate transport system substrate-binding protein
LHWHSPSTKAEFPNREARPLLYEEVVQKEREGLSEALHVLNSSDEEALLAHILDAEHASSAEAMVLFALRKGSFNCLLAPPVDPFAIVVLVKNVISSSASCQTCLVTFLLVALLLKHCSLIGHWAHFFGSLKYCR